MLLNLILIMLPYLSLFVTVGAIYRFIKSVNAGGAIVSKTITQEWGGNQNLDEDIPANQTNLEIAFELTVAKLKGFYMVSDVNMTVETNNGTTPDDTFTLIANEPVQWDASMSGWCPVATLFSADVTALFVTNTTAGTLTVRAIYDPT